MPRGRYRMPFDQVSEFDRGRKVAYRDSGLAFREIGQRVGRNQGTVMRVCHRWMEKTMDRQGPSHHLVAPLPMMTADYAHGSSRSLSHLTNHSTTDSVC
ncbi:hypothetical protein TNCV_2904201 [Trichonephila clavipes]|nr:hypothetical protein TNCV_2904201 [Trichonephila clavipes]